MDVYELGRLLCGLVIVAVVVGAGTFLTYGRWWR